MQYSYDRAARTAASGESFAAFWEKITFKASEALRDLDEKFVGTKDYMGIAYFWNPEYKFELRDAPTNKRREVHMALLKAKLDLDGESPEHAQIVKKILG